MTKQFYFKQFKFVYVICFSGFRCQTVLFNPLIGRCQVLPLRARVDMGAMAMKEYSAFSKALVLLEPHYQIVLDTHGRGSYPSTEKQSAYSTAPADRAVAITILSFPDP